MAQTTITVKAQVEQAAAQFQTLSGKIDQIGERVKSAGQVVEVFKAAFVFDKIKSGVESVISAYRQQELATNTLNAALRSQGLPVDELREKYEKIASAIQNKTVVGDESILAGMAAMQSMVGQKEITEELTMAVVDFAAAKKMDVTQAFELVSKSIAGETNALGRYGIQIDSGASASEKMAQVTQALTEKFTGQAEAQADGLGSLKQLSNAFGDFQEELGKNVAPTLAAIAKNLTAFVNAAREHPTLTKLVTVLALVTAAFAAAVVAINFATGSMSAFWLMITAHPIGAIVTGILILVVGLVTAIVMNLDKLKAYFGSFFETVAEQAKGVWMMLKGAATLDKQMISDGMQMFAEAKDKVRASYDERMAQIEAEKNAGKKAVTEIAAATITADEGVSKNKQKLNDEAAKARDKEEKEFRKAQFDAQVAQHQATINDQDAEMDERLAAFNSLHDLQLAQIDGLDVSERTKAEKRAKENYEHAQALDEFKQKLLDDEEKREDEKRKRDAEKAKEAAELRATGGATREQMAEWQSQGNIWNATGAYDSIGAGALAGGAKAGSMMEGAAASMAIGSIPVVGQILTAADKLVGAAQGLVDFLPNLLNKAAGLAESITNFPETLLKAAQNFVSKISDNLKNAVPNLLKMLPDLLDTIITAAFEDFPNAIQESIPLIMDAIMNLADRLPQIIHRLVEGLIGSSPKIAVGLVTALVPAMPRIAIALVRAMSLEMPQAFALAIRDGMNDAAASLGATWKDIGGSIWNGLVMATTLGQSQESLQNAGSSIWSGLTGKLIGEGGGLFGGLGADIWNGFKAPADIINSFFIALGERIWGGLWPKVEASAEKWKAIGSDIWMGLREKLDLATDRFKDLGGLVWRGLKEKFDGMSDYFKDLGKKIANGFKDAMTFGVGGKGGGGGDTGRVITAIATGGMSEVSNVLEYAKGGIVPQYLAAGAFLPRGTDTIPAMLTPGERVFSVADNKSLINAIAQGQDVRIVLEPRGSLQEIFEKLLVKASVLGTGRISLAVGSEA